MKTIKELEAENEKDLIGCGKLIIRKRKNQQEIRCGDIDIIRKNTLHLCRNHSRKNKDNRRIRIKELKHVLGLIDEWAKELYCPICNFAGFDLNEDQIERLKARINGK